MYVAFEGGEKHVKAKARYVHGSKPPTHGIGSSGRPQQKAELSPKEMQTQRREVLPFFFGSRAVRPPGWKIEDQLSFTRWDLCKCKVF